MKSILYSLWFILVFSGGTPLFLNNGGLLLASKRETDRSKLPYVLEQRCSLATDGKIQGYYLCDPDRDERADLVVVSDSNMAWYSVSDDGMTRVRSVSLPPYAAPLGICDVNRDNASDFLFAYFENDTLMVACHDWHTPPGEPYTIWTVEIAEIGSMPVAAPERTPARLLGCHDSNRDGRNEVYICVEARRGSQRSHILYVLDGPSGETEWIFDSEAKIKDLRLAKIAHDESRIIISTYSQKPRSLMIDPTGSEVTEMGSPADSRYSLIYSLLPNGEENGRLYVPGDHEYVTIDVGTAGRDGYEDIAAGKYFSSSKLKTGAREKIPPWTIAVIDLESLSIINAEFLNVNVHSIDIVDVDLDFINEIILVEHYGKLAILDGNLIPRKIIEDSPHASCSVLDVDLKMPLELICAGIDNVMVRNCDGDLISDRHFEDLHGIAAARIGQSPGVVVYAGDEIGFYSIAEEGHADANRSKYIIVGIVTATIAGIAVLTIKAVRRRADASGIEKEGEYETLLDAMTAFKHDGSSRRLVDRLLFHLNNLGTGYINDDIRRSIDELSRSFSGSVSKELRRIVALSRKAGLPGSIWKTIIEYSNNASRALQKLTATEAVEQEGIEKLRKKAASNLNAISKSIAGIQGYLKEYFNTDVPQVVESVMMKRRPDFTNAGIEPQVKNETGTNVRGFVSHTVLEKTIDNLVMNTVHALKYTSAPRLTVSIFREGGYCKVVVEDNGCGIDEKDWDRVFDRGFSTKKNNVGFGLNYSRTELAKFGGKIFIFASEVGKGTSFCVVLLAVE